MAILFSIIVAIFCYLFGGWCVFNVYCSICPFDGSATLETIGETQILVYTCTDIAINIIALLFAEKNGEDVSENMVGFAVGFPIALYYIFGKILPLSIGGALLCTILSIICSTVCIYQWFKTI